MKSKMSFFSADIANLTILNDDLNSVIDKIAKVLLEWNCFYTYSRSKGHCTGNCQDFVEALLIELGIEPKFTGALATYLEAIKKEGKSGAWFKPTEEFKKEFGIKEDIIEFKTHAQLDTFVMNLQEQNRLLRVKYSGEWQLMKSFDRGFWLNFYAEPDVTNAPININNSICPFGDPNMTGSLIQPI